MSPAIPESSKRRVDGSEVEYTPVKVSERFALKVDERYDFGVGYGIRLNRDRTCGIGRRQRPWSGQ